MAEQQLSLAHLPDGSQELAAAADLPLALDGCTLPLHSQVLAAGSRVLRPVLCGTRDAAGGIGGSQGDGGGSLDPTAAAAVQRAFEGHSPQDVQQFLKFLYSPVAVADAPTSLEAFPGAILLADKLDAPAVLKACDLHLARSAAGDWLEWLRLADACGMPHLLRKAAYCLLSELLQSQGGSVEIDKAAAKILAQCHGLHADTYHMMLHTLLRGVVSSGSGFAVGPRIPSLSTWQPPPAPKTLSYRATLLAA